MKVKSIAGVILYFVIFPISYFVDFHFPFCTVKPVLSGYSKVDKTKMLKSSGSLMQVKSTAECSWNILHYLWPAVRDYQSWKPIFGLLLSGRLRQAILDCQTVWNKFLWCKCLLGFLGSGGDYNIYFISFWFSFSYLYCQTVWNKFLWCKCLLGVGTFSISYLVDFHFPFCIVKLYEISFYDVNVYLGWGDYIF